MPIPQIEDIQYLALNYSKQQLASLARTGQINPQDAVMAGMMQDRIQKANAQPPSTTVAEDVLAPQMPQGVAGLPAQEAPAEEMPVGMEGGIDQAAGLEALPIPEDMYDEQSMAGGGIVAFEEGGDVKDSGGLGRLGASAEQINKYLGENTDLKKVRDYIEKQVGNAEEQARNDVLDAISMAGIEYARTGKLGESAGAGFKQYMGTKAERKKEEKERMKLGAELGAAERSEKLKALGTAAELDRTSPEISRLAKDIMFQAEQAGKPVSYSAALAEAQKISMRTGDATVRAAMINAQAKAAQAVAELKKDPFFQNQYKKIKKEQGEAAAEAYKQQQIQEAVGLFPGMAEQAQPKAAAPAAKSTGLALPKTKDQLQPGKVYDTARGPATWDGRQFIPVR